MKDSAPRQEFSAQVLAEYEATGQVDIHALMLRVARKLEDIVAARAIAYMMSEGFRDGMRDDSDVHWDAAFSILDRAWYGLEPIDTALKEIHRLRSEAEQSKA